MIDDFCLGKQILSCKVEFKKTTNVSNFTGIAAVQLLAGG